MRVNVDSSLDTGAVGHFRQRCLQVESVRTGQKTRVQKGLWARTAPVLPFDEVEAQLLRNQQGIKWPEAPSCLRRPVPGGKGTGPDPSLAASGLWHLGGV